jgi:hypothetical protein
MVGYMLCSVVAESRRGAGVQRSDGSSRGGGQTGCRRSDSGSGGGLDHRLASSACNGVHRIRCREQWKSEGD